MFDTGYNIAVAMLTFFAMPNMLQTELVKRKRVQLASRAKEQSKSLMAILCLSSVLSILPLRNHGAVAEVILSNNEFQVYRQLGTIILTEREANEKLFFFDVNGLVERTALPSNEAKEVGKTAIELLGSRFRLVSSKMEASHLIQMRAERFTFFAIRNPKREPARGLVMISLCRLPIVDMGTDCGNVVFYHFSSSLTVEVLKKVFPMWLSMTLQGSR
jgi:hypothetical protein